MLAGGLTPGNVGEAIALTGAMQVDVSSGVEAAPGVKDAALIAASALRPMRIEAGFRIAFADTACGTFTALPSSQESLGLAGPKIAGVPWPTIFLTAS